MIVREIWYSCICLAEIRGRPKSIKMYLQGHAGTKHGASVYKSRVFPLFDSAGVSVDCVGKKIAYQDELYC